ncbi:major histocompatibility complex class I-related gene protein-like isoform X1 [Synchiropus splendidus]|uniref:major histocompatibility complex class I-related gene protein-like isoform X1 n=1 Tax=Synchiropus splendidus TaxID=270530 RepID=UPI00237DB870|nr:major histocompatibility complex class I-related gene protein-like isoform X1 [Synchiropus splendidus]
MSSDIVCFRPETDASCFQKMIKMTITRVILALCWMTSANAARHHLTYITTASSGVTSFPEYVAVGMMDGVVIYRYDSNNEKAEPRQDWMSQQSSENLEYLNFNTRRCKINQERAKNRVIYLKERFNHTGGVHIVQWIYGCEWDDDETVKPRGHYQLAYDGEDFLLLDLETQTWVAAKQLAGNIKDPWDKDQDLTEYNDFYMNQYCPKWGKKLLDQGKSSLLRTELPSVSLLQKTPSSPIVCHATGFYPPRAKLFWTKGEEIIKDNYAEVLPNHDGTYQMRARLKLPDLSETWESFTCVFQLDGTNLTTKLDKKAILIKWKPDQTIPIAVSVAALVLLVAAAAVIGVVMRRRAGKSAETDSNSSEEALNPLNRLTKAPAHVGLDMSPSDLLVEPQPEAT